MGDTKWPSETVRKTFLSFFCEKKGHLHVPSSPVVPYDDPTLLFTNSGMNQFKPIFLGQVDPKSPSAKWTRAANSQKCIRAGGKHNDLDDVGKDTYHHTYFEMLGNWSFGDYYKEEAISWAWELLIEVYGLEKKRLYATYFGGDETDGLPADLEARDIWLRFLPTERVIPFGRKENFWEMGDTGPCGPCSELHYDRLSDRENASELVNADSPDLIEIWNLVFMAYNREESGKLTTLPACHIDTGMGFERVTSILQDKPSNYDTDVFTPIFQRIMEVTGARPYTGHVGADDKDGIDTAYRIVADHIRTLTFSLSDGATPSGEGRGFVLRRILRRAVRYGKDFLGAKNGYFHDLVDVVVDKFGDAFPEIRTNPQRVKRILEQEEKQFEVTMQKGANKFKGLTKNLKAGDTLSGDAIFDLHSSTGFPLDLTEIMCEELNIKPDTVRFAELLNIKKQESINAHKLKQGGGGFNLQAKSIAQLRSNGVLPTNDGLKYLKEATSGTIKAIWQGTPENGSFVDTCTGDCGVILDQTSFYAESGGQISDTGTLIADGLVFVVKDVKSFGGFVAHIGSIKEGTLSVGTSVQCLIDQVGRKSITSNHTSTHLVNFALRKILPSEADQRGSIVSEDRLRFDFNYPEALSRGQVFDVERVVHGLIQNKLPVYVKEVPLEQANKIRGRRAVFAEAYPDPVRVVSVGVEVEKLVENPYSDTWKEYSIEFCGGTHLGNTEEAEEFVIVSEESVSLGERRIIAVTGKQAKKANEEGKRLEKLLETVLGTPLGDLGAALLGFKEELSKCQIPAYLKLDIREKLEDADLKVKKAEKEELSETKVGLEVSVNKILEKVKGDASLSVLVELLEVGDNNRVLSDTAVRIVTSVKEQFSRSVAVLLLSVDAKKGTVVIVGNVPDDFIAKGLKAPAWVNEVAKVLGGKGGGRPKGDVAQGFGNKLEDLEAAIKLGVEYGIKF